MTDYTAERQQCEKDVLAALGRHGSACRMQARGEVNDPFIEKKKGEFREVLRRLVDAANEEGIEDARQLLVDAGFADAAEALAKEIA